MRRDRRIINLHDKPLHPRPRLRSHSSATSGVGTAILLCCTITIGTAGFFWAYGAMAHRGSVFIPALSAQLKPLQRQNVSEAAPAPDMNAPAVAMAEADVPATPGVTPAASSESRAEIEATAETPRKKKKVHVAHRRLASPALGFAAEPSFYQAPAPFGGW
jgi:hypothetical protein